jgi:hypothetical protein
MNTAITNGRDHYATNTTPNSKNIRAYTFGVNRHRGDFAFHMPIASHLSRRIPQILPDRSSRTVRATSVPHVACVGHATLVSLPSVPGTPSALTFAERRCHVGSRSSRHLHMHYQPTYDRWG